MTTLDEYLRRLALRRALYRCAWHDIRVCCSPNWHRKYWKYDGKGRFSCEICRTLERVCA